jgi:hypothetical protein
MRGKKTSMFTLLLVGKSLVDGAHLSADGQADRCREID